MKGHLRDRIQPGGDKVTENTRVGKENDSGNNQLWPTKMRIQLMGQEDTMCEQVDSHSHNASVTMTAERNHLVPVGDHSEWSTACPLHLSLSRFEISAVSKKRSPLGKRKRQCSELWPAWIASLKALDVKLTVTSWQLSFLLGKTEGWISPSTAQKPQRWSQDLGISLATLV